MNINRAVNFEDIRKLAKRRLPRIMFDFIDGGVEDEECIARNRQAFRRHTLVPRYLVDVSTRDQSVTLFGRTYSSPFGIAPTGVGSLFRSGADLMLAEAAAAANIPFIMSSVSNASIESAVNIAPDTTWFQIYGTTDPTITHDLVRRADVAGVGTLLLTVDFPAVQKRERDIRNGFTRPLKMRLSTVLEALGHPAWLFSYLSNGGTPMMENWAPYAGDDAGPNEVADLFGSRTPAPAQTWQSLETIRNLWTRTLVVKGILHPDDAVRCADVGVDGIVVSNHGGRQLDRAPSPLEMLPAIRDKAGERLTIMLDSGIRRGSDIVIALCLGARFVFFGRPTLFGVAAAGKEGAQKVIDIVRREVDLVQAQIGCPKLSMLGPEILLDPPVGRSPGGPSRSP
jgi:L-lactate dehydrogenase (cytochrome)/(S)-mandelate dehydrogenase